MLQLLKIILKLQFKTQNFKKLSLKKFIGSKKQKIESIEKNGLHIFNIRALK